MNAMIFGAPAWSDERVAQLRRHYRVGLTASESALLLGGVTKNAVIAKRQRLGLRGLAAAAHTVLGPQAPRRARMTRVRLPPPFRCEPLPPMDPYPPPGANPKPLARHLEGECLWPLGPVEVGGDWRTLFCCARAKPEGAYCAAHAIRARV
jgi:GcrA cell cycle regulator